MKSIFSGFYSIDEDTSRDIWSKETTLFVFDTNCLLNLYRCEDQTRQDILDVMRAISERTWIPFQVGFEYQRSRRKVIADSIKHLSDLKSELEKINIKNVLSSSNIRTNLYTSLTGEIKSLQETLKKTIDDYIDSNIVPRIELKKGISSHDSIRVQIDEIINTNVGSPPSQETVNAINKDGEHRYSNKIAPGHLDADKTGSSFHSNVEFKDKFGDLYLWKEIIEKAKDQEIESVIFICDDAKDDWWFKQSGQTHGILESLKSEICRESNLKNFKAMSQLSFLYEAEKYLNNIKIQESSLKEVKELTEVDAHKKPMPHYQKIDFDAVVKQYNDKVLFKHSEIDFTEDYLIGKDVDYSSDLLSNLSVKLDIAREALSLANNVASDVLEQQDEIKSLYTDEIYSGIKDALFSDIFEVKSVYQKIHGYLYSNSMSEDAKRFLAVNDITKLSKATKSLNERLIIIQEFLSESSS